MLFSAQKGKTSRWLEATAQKRRAEREEAEESARAQAAAEAQAARARAEANELRGKLDREQHAKEKAAAAAVVVERGREGNDGLRRSVLGLTCRYLMRYQPSLMMNNWTLLWQESWKTSLD